MRRAWRDVLSGARRPPSLRGADARHDHAHDSDHGTDHDLMRGVRLGVRGSAAGAVVAVDTSIHVDGTGQPLRWFVMSEDRLHTPADEPSLRVSTPDGAPVVTQRIALPGGDAALTTWMVADDGGSVVVEFANESPRACALIIDGPPARSQQQPRPVAGVSGVPATARSYSVGHRTTTRFVVGRGSTEPQHLPAADRVLAGWVAASATASSVDIPGTTLSAALVAARSRIAVAHDHEWEQLLEHAPDLGVLGLAERARMGETLGEWSAPVADAVARIARATRTMRGPRGRAIRAVQQAAHALSLSGERRGADDADDVWRRISAPHPIRDAAPDPLAAHDLGGPQRFDLATAIDVAAGIEQRFVRATSAGDGGIILDLFASGLPAPWRGIDGRVEKLSAGPRHSLSFAMRWHGPRLAILWECAGPAPVTIRAERIDPAWSVTGMRGDALLEVTPES